MDRAGQQVRLIPSFSCSISYFSARHLAERVEDIFYQRPADNEGLQMKYLVMRADETGGIMKMEDLEIVYRDVGMSRYYIAKPSKNCDTGCFFLHWASPKMLEYPNWASQKKLKYLDWASP